MGAYILRRLLLVIPTLVGVMVINFALTQFVPGGPIEQILAEMQGEGNVAQAITGGGQGDAGQQGGQGGLTGGADDKYIGARGLPPEFIAKLEKEFGLDKPPLERFLTMMWNYLRFDFGDSYFRSVSVLSLVAEKMPVSISLGLWSTILAYLISIPLGIRKAVKDGTTFDSWTSGVLIAAYAIPGFLFAVLLLVVFAGGSYYQWFPLRGLLSDNLSGAMCWPSSPQFSFAKCTREVIPDYFWHITLPTIASSISGFTFLTLLTKNSFLEEVRKQYVMTARAKGLTERRVLYGHVFRNAMLLVIAGFPALFLSIFFSGSVIIEYLFSLDGLGRLGYEAALQRDYPVIFGTLYFFGLISLIMGIVSDLMYVAVDPRIDFETRET